MGVTLTPNIWVTPTHTNMYITEITLTPNYMLNLQQKKEGNSDPYKHVTNINQSLMTTKHLLYKIV